MTNIIDYWPFQYKPRPNQVKALEWLANQKTKYLILEAPVGSGKSNIAITLSHYLSNNTITHGESYILTPQRILQEQYLKSTSGNKNINMSTFYGKKNYICSKNKLPCDVSCVLSTSCTKCTYIKDRDKSIYANDTVLNYHLALSMFGYTEIFNKRRLLVIDECHNLESTLVEFDSIKIYERLCNTHNIKYNHPDSIEDAIKWIKSTYLPKLSIHINKYREYYTDLANDGGKSISKAMAKEIIEYNELCSHFDDVEELSLRPLKYINDNFILVNDNQKHFKLMRVKGDYTFLNTIATKADTILLMSSTILDKDSFCEDLGIPPSEASFMSLGSDFKPENRNVVYIPTMRVNAAWKSKENENDRDKLLEQVSSILNDVHSNDSGIIHTGNFQIAEWLSSELKQRKDIKHKIFTNGLDSNVDRNKTITGFISSKTPSILILPAITEGLDLKGDLGRFSIFVKVPYGNLGDQWIKRRMEMSLSWYQRKAITEIIQGSGRVVRSDDDWGVTYILDSSWEKLYNTARNMIPKWWIESYSKL